MPKQLFLLRHAKSSWDDPALADHDRPLAPRGRKAAALMASYLSEERIRPALVLCSTAVRARETLEGIGLSDHVIFARELYGASADELLARLRRVPDEIESAMLVGHNPGMHDLALLLGGTGDIERKFPTGALATFAFDGGWSGLGQGRAELVAFVRPKQLG
ncbi:MAG: SixA phosphatase family protein [Gaiellaceae bacterium]